MKEALVKTFNSIKTALPILLGVFLLVNLINPFLENYYPKIFSGNIILDPLFGAIGGSVAFGIPLTSYVIGGELLERGISLAAVTAFILAWVSVGLVMIPLESSALGKKFAITRNIINFVFAIIIAILATITFKIFS